MIVLHQTYFPNNDFPHKIHSKLLFIMYHALFYWYLKQLIYCLVENEWKRDFMCQKLIWVLWFLIGNLITEKSMLYTLFFNFVFNGFDFFPFHNHFSVRAQIHCTKKWYILKTKKSIFELNFFSLIDDLNSQV